MAAETYISRWNETTWTFRDGGDYLTAERHAKAVAFTVGTDNYAEEAELNIDLPLIGQRSLAAWLSQTQPPTHNPR